MCQGEEWRSARPRPATPHLIDVSDRFTIGGTPFHALSISHMRSSGDDRIGVAYMITPFGDGGAERQLVEILKRLDRGRFSPVLFVTEVHGHIALELERLDVPVVNMGGKDANERVLIRMVGELRRRRPHIVHSMLFVANTWGRVAGRLARVPAVITSELGPSPDRRRIYRWLDIALEPLADRVVVNAEALADHVHRVGHVPRAKLVTILNGVDLDHYGRHLDRSEARRRLGLPLDTPVVGMAARLVSVKRWDVFLEAIAHLAADRPIIAVCAGDGPLREALERLAVSRGLGNTVRFIGFESDIPAFLAALDAFVLTSDAEGMPNAVLEAMAMGLPVVATDAGGIREAVVSGKTGFVVPLQDPEAIALAVERLLDDPERAADFGAAGRKRVKSDFTLEAATERLQTLYEATLVEKLGGDTSLEMQR